jgi:membrane protein insertase Oxa1/YidC/SpoIIIJ
MRQTWQKAVHSLDTGILTLSRFTFGKAAFAIILVAFLHHLIYFPLKVRSARQMKRNAEKLKELAPAITQINEKYNIEPGQRLQPAEVRRKGKEIQQLQKKAGIKFSAGCLTAALPSLSGGIIELAIMEIKKDERFQDSGILWFKDLTKPERFYVLTAGSIGISYLKQRFDITAHKRPGEASSVLNQRIRTFMNWSPLLTFGLVLITRQQQPSAVVLYRIASSGCGLVEDYFIQKLVTSKEETANP